MRIRFTVITAALLFIFVATAALAAPTIKIGALFAVTGPAAFLGEPETQYRQDAGR